MQRTSVSMRNLLLLLRMMEVELTTGAKRRAKLQSNCHHQQTNTQLFTGRMPFLSPSRKCQSTEGQTRLLCDYFLLPLSQRLCFYFNLFVCRQGIQCGNCRRFDPPTLRLQTPAPPQPRQLHLFKIYSCKFCNISHFHMLVLPVPACSTVYRTSSHVAYKEAHCPCLLLLTTGHCRM